MDLSWFYRENAPYVVPYSISHILYLIFCFTVIYLVVRYRAQIRAKRTLYCNVFLGILLFQQIVLLYGWYIVVTGFDLANALPLHICRVSSILTLFALIKRNLRDIDVIFYFGIFALCSFFYPMNVYNFGHINGISYMINHLMTVIIPIFGAIAYDWRPSWAGFKKVVLPFTAYFMTAFFVNPLLGGNYFYLVERPFLNSWSYEAYSLFSYTGTLLGFALVTAGLLAAPNLYKAYLKRFIKQRAPAFKQ